MVDTVLSIEGVVTWLVFVGTAAFELFAFVDAAVRPAHAFVSADKLTKPAWMLMLGLALAACVAFRSPIGILSLLGVLAASVYVADVRPAVSGRRGRR